MLLTPDLLCLQELFDLLRCEFPELRGVRGREAFEFPGVEPDPFAVQTHIHADVPGVLDVHQPSAVRADELAVRIEAEVLGQKFVQTPVAGELPNLLLVKEDSVAPWAEVHFDSSEMGVTKVLAQRRPVSRALPGLSDFAGHSPGKVGEA